MTEFLSTSPREVEIVATMRNQWLELVSEVGGRVDLVEKEFSYLVSQYQSPDRSYHNLLHIGAVGEILNRYRYLARNFVALKFAGDGHDVVYVPGSGTNEDDSAAYMEESMTVLQIPQTIITETKRIIIISKDHKTEDDDIDGKLMVDADFAILASPNEQYDAYAQGIWQEYVGSGRIPEDRFKMGRRNIIRGWLAQDKIFLTDEIKRDLEPQARQNLERELLKLGN